MTSWYYFGRMLCLDPCHPDAFFLLLITTTNKQLIFFFFSHRMGKHADISGGVINCSLCNTLALERYSIRIADPKFMSLQMNLPDP